MTLLLVFYGLHSVNLNRLSYVDIEKYLLMIWSSRSEKCSGWEKTEFSVR